MDWPVRPLPDRDRAVQLAHGGPDGGRAAVPFRHPRRDGGRVGAGGAVRFARADRQGHATDIAVILGLLGEQPDRIDPDQVPALVQAAVAAKHGDGTHFVSLDQVIRTMRDTGRDMLSKYKETSEGGLAVNATEC